MSTNTKHPLSQTSPNQINTETEKNIDNSKQDTIQENEKKKIYYPNGYLARVP